MGFPSTIHFWIPPFMETSWNLHICVESGVNLGLPLCQCRQICGAYVPSISIYGISHFGSWTLLYTPVWEVPMIRLIASQDRHPWWSTLCWGANQNSVDGCEILHHFAWLKPIMGCLPPFSTGDSDFPTIHRSKESFPSWLCTQHMFSSSKPNNCRNVVQFCRGTHRNQCTKRSNAIKISGDMWRCFDI